MAAQQTDALIYSVRGRVVLKYFGHLCLALSAFPLVTLIVSLLAGELTFALRYGMVIVVLSLLGFICARLRAPSNMQSNEALAVTALIFPFSSLVLSYPMMASGLSFGDALFEAVSAVTTTGLSTISNVEEKPLTFLFARSWMQWAGGLGIVVLSVALLIRPDVAVKRLIEYDEHDDIVGGTRLYARRVLKVYLVLTIAGIVILLLLGVGPVPALLHTLAGVSTGGFSSYNLSLAGFGSGTARAAVILISFSGAIALSLYYRAFQKGWRTFFGDIQLHALVAASLSVTCLLAFSMNYVGSMNWEDALRNAPLLAFSAQTTAGFAPLDVSKLDPASKLVLIFSMTIGGSIGSTAGGLKILRVVILVRLLGLAVMKACVPAHAVVRLRLSGQRMESEEIERTLLLILLFIGVIVLSWLPFVIMGYSPLDSLFEVVSATGTVGLSAGITQSSLPALLKAVLCADMLMGRLEVFAFLIILYPRTWFGRRVTSK